MPREIIVTGILSVIFFPLFFGAFYIFRRTIVTDIYEQFTIFKFC